MSDPHHYPEGTTMQTTTQATTRDYARWAWIAYQRDGGKITYTEWMANLGFHV